MDKNSNLNYFIPALLSVLYLSIGFIPNLSAVDKIAPQWLAMSILNGISILFLIYKNTFFKSSISRIFKASASIFYAVFILWAGLSYFYAINSTEVLVNITRQVNVFLMFLILAIFTIELPNKIKFLSWVIVLFLGFELYAVLLDAKVMLSTQGRIDGGMLKGVTANRNITAFSIVNKIPFVLYLIYLSRKKAIKFFLLSISFLSILCLTMIQSRAAFIATGFILLSYSIFHLILYRVKKSKIINIGFFLIPLLLAIGVNQLFFSNKGADVISRAATISLSSSDNSINSRIRYYQDVLTHIKSNPFIGVGLGNWKLKSIDYDAKDIKGYVVPYHAHSDFIQLGAELGIVGFILYLSIFLIVAFYSYRLIRFSNLKLHEKAFVFFLFVSLITYSIDANLNFPIARPQVLVVWALVIALITGYHQNSLSQAKNLKSNSNIILLVLALIFVIPGTYISNQVYKSLKGQMFLLQDFNTNKYSVPLDKVDDIVPEIPNITVTTIPLKSVKARYYLNAKKYDKALQLADQGTSANPYLFYSELLKSQIFSAQGKLDSAKLYAKKAFFGLPGNDLHAATYLNLISQTRDDKALEESFELLTYNKNFNNWKNYLILAKNFSSIDNSILVQRAKNAVDIFPNNAEIKSIYNLILVGEQNISKATQVSNSGLNYFNKKDFKNAAIQFQLAIENNPLDYAHFENAASANYMIGNFDKALEQINVVVNTMNPLNGKCEYIKALILLRLGDNREACSYLNTSLNNGYSASKAVLEQTCQ